MPPTTLTLRPLHTCTPPAPSNDPYANNLPPPNGATAGGWVTVNKDGVLTVELLNITGAPLWAKTLYPEESGRVLRRRS